MKIIIKINILLRVYNYIHINLLILQNIKYNFIVVYKREIFKIINHYYFIIY